MRFFLLLAALGLSCFASAQRVGELRFAVPYHVAPAEQLPEQLTTYSTRVLDRYRRISRTGLTKLGLQKQLRLRNFRHLGVGGHLLVTYDVDLFRTNDVKARSKTTETKKKDGTVVKNTTHWVAGTYTMPITMEVVDQDGGLIFESIVGVDEMAVRYPAGSKTYSSRAALIKDWNAKRRKLYYDLQKNHLSKGFATMNGRLRAQIDVREAKDYFYFEYPKGKKAENAELWLEHATATKALLDTIDSGTALPQEHLVSALAPHLDWWKAQMAAYPADNKKTQRYHHSAAYNLATVHLLLEKTGESKDFSKRLMDNVKWNKSRSRAINAKAEATGKAIAAKGTRHFALRDLRTAEGPKNPLYGMPAPIAPSYDTIPGYVTISGKKVAGTVIIRENVDISFNGKPNFRFFDSNTQQVAIDVNKLDGLGFGDFDFVVTYWADAGLSKRPHFMRVLADGPKMQYLQYYRSYPNGSPEEVEFLKQMGVKKDPISLSIANVRWLSWKKAFSKVFNDCPGLAQRVSAGEFRRNQRDIQAAIQVYNEGDCEVAAEADDKK